MDNATKHNKNHQQSMPISLFIQTMSKAPKGCEESNPISNKVNSWKGIMKNSGTPFQLGMPKCNKKRGVPEDLYFFKRAKPLNLVRRKWCKPIGQAHNSPTSLFPRDLAPDLESRPCIILIFGEKVVTGIWLWNISLLLREKRDAWAWLNCSSDFAFSIVIFIYVMKYTVYSYKINNKDISYFLTPIVPMPWLLLFLMLYSYRSQYYIHYWYNSNISLKLKLYQDLSLLQKSLNNKKNKKWTPYTTGKAT